METLASWRETDSSRHAEGEVFQKLCVIPLCVLITTEAAVQSLRKKRTRSIKSNPPKHIIMLPVHQSRSQQLLIKQRIDPGNYHG